MADDLQGINAIKTRFELKKDDENNITIAKNEVKFRDFNWTLRYSHYFGVTFSVKSSKESEGKSVFAKFHLKVISSQTDEVLFQSQIGPKWCFPVSYKYNHYNCSDFYNIFILDKKVIQEENGYFFNNKCLLEVEIEAGPLQKAVDDEWVTLETIHEPCQDSPNKKIRFKVKKPLCFVGLCSPVIMIDDVPWIAGFIKQNNEFKVQLLLKTDLKLRQGVGASCQLMSFNPTINSLQSRKSLGFGVDKVNIDIFTVDWATFTSSKNQFIENNEFIFEIEFELETVVGLPVKAKKRPAPAENNLVQLQCPICLESIVGKNISSTRCGHIFCTTCVKTALRGRAVCPLCNFRARSNHLRETFLPLK